jgi:hypothetical protein
MKVLNTYYVVYRNTSMIGNKITHKNTRRTKRIFLGTEKRFGSIKCYVFSSKVMKGKQGRSEISIPHYDLVEATAI